MNEIIERELRRVPSDWNNAVGTLRGNEQQLREWLSISPAEQFILVGDQDTASLAHWGARTLGLISQGVIWGSSEDALLAADSPPTGSSSSSTLVVFLSRRGGSIDSVKVCRKMDQWFSRNRKIALMSSPGVLSSHADKVVLFDDPELTATPTLTPTRLMVALMTLGAIITGKDVLTKRAELLSQWYVEASARDFTKMLQNAPGNIRIAAPKRLFSHCLPLKESVENATGRTQDLIDLDGAKPLDEPSTILGITAKSSEVQDLQNLSKLKSDNVEIIAFSSKAPDGKHPHITLSRRTTDIGRTIHAMLNIQKLLLCLSVKGRVAI